MRFISSRLAPEPSRLALEPSGLALEPLAGGNVDGQRGLHPCDCCVCLVSEILEDVEEQAQKEALDERDHRADETFVREAKLGSKANSGTGTAQVEALH